MVAVKPLPKELPSEYAIRVGSEDIKNKSLTHKKTFAQYYTPLMASHFMAGLANTEKSEVKIADLGAGSGVLGISVCEVLANKNPKLRKIELTAYEIDDKLIPVLRDTLLYAKKWLAKKNIELVIHVINKDFILENAYVLQYQQSLTRIEKSPKQLFDIIISNPPYFKLNKSDPRAIATSSVIHGQPNIYALFMAIAVHLLAQNGELIFITPRSYAAGPYFRLFREHFFSHVEPTFIHLFGSRDKAFEKDDVLQENIILKAKRKELHKTHPDTDHQVQISYCNDISDLQSSQTRIVPQFEVIDMATKNKVLRIPLTKRDDQIIKLIHSWKCRLDSYGMRISQGPWYHFVRRN